MASSGWQIGLFLGEAPISDRDEAEVVLATFGCKVDWDEDSANGVWAATLSEEIVSELLTNGWVERKNPSGYVLKAEVDEDQVDLGDDSGEAEEFGTA